MNHVPSPRSPLSLRTKLIYGMGDWGTSAADTGRSLFWLFFLVSVVGLSAGVAGTIVLIGRLWDAVNDPLIGMVTDRTDTRWGRRRPFFLFGAIPFGVGFILMFAVPPLSGTMALAVYYTFAFLFFNTVYTLINVPYAALTAELTQDYDERSSLVGWRMSFSIFASLVTGAAFKIVAEQLFASLLADTAQSVQTGYLMAAVLWAMTMVIPPLLLFQTVREPGHAPVTGPIRPLQTLREVYANRPFRLGATVYFLTFSTTEMVLAVFVWFLVFYLRVPPGFDSQVLATALLVALLSMPLIVKMMHRFGKRETFIICMTFWIAVLVIISRVAPGEHHLIWLAAIFAGVGLGAAHVVPWAMVADVVEEDELRTGQRREGIYAGYLVFFRKLAGAISVFFVGWVLELNGFVSSTTGGLEYVEQPAGALLAIRIFISAVPAVMLFLAILVAWHYPLNRKAHDKLRFQLAERREGEKDG
jgi:glycoside/pentoside/hexuronide:cation symporter, GPH family